MMRRGDSGRGRTERRAEIPQAAPRLRPCIPTPLIPACGTRCRCPSPSPASFYAPFPRECSHVCCKSTAPCPRAWCCGLDFTEGSHRAPPRTCIRFYREAITLSNPLFLETTTAPRYSVGAAANAL